MDNNLLKRYAEFAVRSGVNVQKGQTLIINTLVDTADFARVCADVAFDAGARDVVVHYGDERLSRLRMDRAEVEALEDVKPWQLDSYMQYYEGEGGVCRLAILASDPEVYKGLNPEKVAKTQQARSKAMRPWMNLMMANKAQWCLVALPTPAWATKVFPGEAADVAVEKLMQAIATVCRLNTPDPIAAWDKIIEDARRRCDVLNSAGLTALHLRGENGTDLRVGLPEDYLFVGVESRRAGDGLRFLANIPSEEIFGGPHRDKVDGIVKSSLPYVYNGDLIENITARFENGVAVEAHAEKGDALLQQMLDADEGARHLGEIALVPASSPVRQTGLLFYNTLFDENAACHMAFGASYPENIRGGNDMERDTLLARGMNDSLIHEDIMIGTPEMDIDGIKADGGILPIFRKGEWAF